MRAFIVFAVIISSGFAAPWETMEDIPQKTSKLSNVDNIEEVQRIKKSSHAPFALNLGPTLNQNHEDEHSEDDHKARAYLDASINLAGPAYGKGLSTSAIASAGGSYSAIPSGVGYSGASGAGYSGAATAASGGYAGLSGASYSGAPSVGYSGAQNGGYGSHGSALGIFPNAHISSCNVPLLLSCAPNVVSGHLAESHSYANPAPAYRSFDEDMRMAEEWAQARKASHHKVSEDYPEPHPGNHHVVSQDYPQPNLVHVVPHQHIDQAGKN